MAKKQKWIDLAEHGVYLGDQRMADGKHRLVVLDMQNRGDSARLREIGFLPVLGAPRYDKGIYYLHGDDQRLRPKSLAKAFGITNCPLVEVEPAEIDQVFREKITEKFDANLNALTMRSRFLGQNQVGQSVYESPAGRFIRLSSDNAVTEWAHQATKLGRPAFLRASNDEELRACAEGFIWTIRRGEKNTWPDLVQFARTVYGHSARDEAPSHAQLHHLQEAVEAASYRNFTALTDKPDEAAFRLAIDFYYGLPAARMRTAESVFLQQYSTPLPMSVIAQRLLLGNDDPAGRSVLEPTAGNGGLVNLLPKAVRVFAVELDANRFAALRETGRVQPHQGDAIDVEFRRVFDMGSGFDYTIANPPFGQMKMPKAFDKIQNVRKLDHYIPLRALAARKDSGRSVVIFGADNTQSDGTIKGGTKTFLNYIHDHYEVHGLIEVDGRLYARQGAGFNVRLLVIGHKRSEPVQAKVPETLPIITGYDDLWRWAGHVIERYDTPKLEAGKEVAEPVVNASTLGSVKPLFGAGMVAVRDAGREPVSQAVLPKHPDLNVPAARHVNEYQTPYQAASRIGEPTAMLPINMAGATYAALNDLESRFGSIDQYVAGKLRYQEEQLPRYFSPEQVDAIGLAIKAVEEGRGIINADQTGMGKGRFVAAMLRYAKLNGKMPVFLTIKPELFTDIFRDINDIDSQHLFKKLFIFNEGESVRRFGTENEVLYRATPPHERKAALTGSGVESDTDMVLATYSQFMRAYHKNPKAALLTEIAANNGMLILDEAHVASGASNLSRSVGQAVENSAAVLYASATPLKGVSNFAIYSKVFPDSVDLRTLPETLKTGGEALQEAISTNMARDGVLIRREHDFSKLIFHTRDPDVARRRRNIELADALADIIGEMSYLAGDVSKSVSDMNKEYKRDWEHIPEKDRQGARMQASSMNFGSRLYSLNRQFLLGIKIEDAVETALDDLANGRKPVIAVENTGESLLRQVISRRAGIEHLEMELIELDERTEALGEEEKARRDVLVSSISDAMRNVILDEPPQYRELLESMLDRIGVIKVQGRYGDVKRIKPESVEYQEAEIRVREKIRLFPDLPLTPIDVVKKELQQRGYPVAEVSGRTASIMPNAANPAVWDVNFHVKADAVANVAGFQNGKYDAIVITRSGSTGISLHATDRFEDSDIRQRNFIVLQKAANIAEFLQWMGRVNRKDQVVPPVITGLESGLPAELRLTMMHNAKLRKLSANTTSNRENANLEGEEFDLLNDVGDRVALEWLAENPDVTELLDIHLPSDDDLEDSARFTQECPYINKLMGRLMMVSVEKQEEILKTLTERFADKIEELEHRGESPFKVNVFDWKAKIIKEEELQSGVIRSAGSTFDEPVKLVTLRYDQDVFPIRSGKLLGMLRSGLELFRAEPAVDERGSLRSFRRRLEEMKDGWVRSQLPSKLRESEEPLSLLLGGNNVAGAKSAKERANWLLENIDAFHPGVRLAYEDPFKGERKGIITSVELPKRKEDFFLLSKYRAKVAFPGEDRVREITLATLRAQGRDLFSVSWISIDPDKMASMPHIKQQFEQVKFQFDAAPDGKVVRTQYILQGNIFRACELASKQKLGSTILFTDEEGNRQRAVLLKDRITPEMVKALPVGLDAHDICDYIDEYLDPKHPEFRQRSMSGTFRVYDAGVKDMKKGEGIMFELLNGGDAFRLSIPGTRLRAGALMTDGAIFDIGQKTPEGSLRLKLSGTRSCMKADVGRECLRSLMTLMQRHHHVGKFYVPEPDHDVVKALKERSRPEHGKNPEAVTDDGMAP